MMSESTDQRRIARELADHLLATVELFPMGYAQTWQVYEEPLAVLSAYVIRIRFDGKSRPWLPVKYGLRMAIEWPDGPWGDTWACSWWGRADAEGNAVMALRCIDQQIVGRVVEAFQPDSSLPF